MPRVRPGSRMAARSSSISSTSGDQGKYFTGGVMASLAAELYGKGLKVADLFGSHGWFLVGGISPMPLR